MAGAPVTTERRPSFCRVCINFCPIVATVADGRVVRVEGDRANSVWKGYSCAKGRVQAERMYGSHRLLRSRRRTSDGRYESVPVADAMDEIAARLAEILESRGPDAVAYYQGSGSITHATTDPFAHAFLDAIGVRSRFTPNTIDKPGKAIAKALHGRWQAPAQGFHDPDVALIVGANPEVGFEGAPIGHPGWLRKRIADGMQLVVIDPRLTATARLATIHLRPRPGHDAAILASLLRVILDEELHDRGFVEAEVTGLGVLRSAVEPYQPDIVAARSGVEAGQLVEAARVFAHAARGYVFSGTGPSMSSPGPIVEYLVLCLLSVCGRWLRAGERVENVPAVFRTPVYKAQAKPPVPARKEHREFGVRDLLETVAGPPTAALPEKMLLGEGGVRALISCGGNPVGAWPGRDKVVRALRSLDLLVQIDPVMSETAMLADFVIAPKMALEHPDITMWHDFMAMHGIGYGNAVSHGQYTPAVVDPPDGSDLIGEWEFFYGLARRMGLQLEIRGACYGFPGIQPFAVDMTDSPDDDELLERLAYGARIPLAEVKLHQHGDVFPEPAVRVQPKEEGCTTRLDVGSSEMMAELDEIARGLIADDARVDGELRLICRRTPALFNSWLNDGLASRGRRDNPAFVHPVDLRRLGLKPGDHVEIHSAHGAIRAVVEADGALLPGLVSMSHGFGAVDSEGAAVDDVELFGSSIQLLLSDLDNYDAYSGMPRMSNVPVRLVAVAR